MEDIYRDSKELIEFLQGGEATETVPIERVLEEGGYIKASQMPPLMHQKDNQFHDYDQLGQFLVDKKLLTPEAFARVLSRTLGIPYVHLQDFDVEPTVINFVPVDIARAHEVMPLFFHDNMLVVALKDPSNRETLDLLSFLTPHLIVPTVSTREEIEMAISKYYGPGDDSDLLDDLSVPEEKQEEQSQSEELRLAQEKPTVRLVNHIILDGINGRASDIHIRPREHEVDLLFRIDGSLIKIRSFSRSLLPSVVSRIKILGGMDIAEHRMPQDGQAQVTHRGLHIDLRISLIPSIHGESIVIRILDKSMSLKTLDQVGFTERDEAMFASLLHKSHGMILVTGPTGCGKSTTLYAALQEVIGTGVNVITVEDPVEYHVDGLMQIQVNHSIGYNFARALRHILRHDPDVIMVGEIRDIETAKVAVESSLTGHIVLSTLHTNSAATTITRLLEMGIEPYLVNTSLLAVLAQRLVRKNCDSCIEEEKVPAVVRENLGVPAGEKFYRGKGCDHCHFTGYHGRVAVYELLTVSARLRGLIKPSVSALDLETCALEEGMVPLTDMALELARKKTTSLEEVYRVRLS